VAAALDLALATSRMVVDRAVPAAATSVPADLVVAMVLDPGALAAATATVQEDLVTAIVRVDLAMSTVLDDPAMAIAPDDLVTGIGPAVPVTDPIGRTDRTIGPIAIRTGISRRIGVMIVGRM
jgi:hypothetical protein